MVSVKTIISIGAIVGVVGLVVGLGGPRGIGEKLRSGFDSVSQSFVAGLGFGGGTNDSAANQTQTLQGIVDQYQLAENVEAIPKEPIDAPLPDLQLGRLTLAQFIKDQNISGKINLTTGDFRNKFTLQPLDFIIGKGGSIKTGLSGLGQSTIAAQAALSQRFGIPTFDVKGNLSTFGGLVSAGDR